MPGQDVGSARHTHMRRPLGVALAAVILFIAGCSAPGSASPGSPSPSAHPRVGISLPTKTKARWVLDSAGLVEPLTALGYDPDLQVAEDDPNAQASQVADMIREGVKVLVIAPVDGVDLTADLADAAARGIKVLAYDRLIDDPAHVDAFVGFDSYQVGVLQATSIVDGLDLAGRPGTFSIELYGGNPGDPGARVAFQGAMSILGPYLASGRLVVPSGETAFESVAVAAWDVASAQSRMDRILRASYAERHLDAVLSPYDAISRAVIVALKGAGYYAAGRPGPIVTGQDAEIPSVRSILAGEQTSTVFRDTRALAVQAVRMIDQLATGRPADVGGRQLDIGDWVVPAFLLRPVAVDKSSVTPVLIASGYLDPANLK